MKITIDATVAEIAALPALFTSEILAFIDEAVALEEDTEEGESDGGLCDTSDLRKIYEMVKARLEKKGGCAHE